MIVPLSEILTGVQLRDETKRRHITIWDLA